MPNLFPVDTTGLPPFHPDIAAWRRPYTPGPLTPDELTHYYEYGFVIKYDLLPPSLLDSVIHSVEHQVDALTTKLIDAHRISDPCTGVDFFHRLTALESQFPSICTLLHRQGRLPAEVQRLWTCEQLMGVAKQIIGPDTAGHPVWNLRTKIPAPKTVTDEAHADQATVPMHQDAAYLDHSADHVLQLTAWTPLLDATVENGCMQVLKGGHRVGVVNPHVGCAQQTWYIEMDMAAIPDHLHVDLERDLVTCEVPFGSVLFLNNLIPHRSLPNLTDRIRWSFDLRWQNPALPTGFFGLKDPILLSTSADPHYTADWSTWADIDRQLLRASPHSSTATEVAEQRKVDGHGGGESIDEFETRIGGQWMDRWPLINENRHTRFWKDINVGTTVEERRALVWKS